MMKAFLNQTYPYTRCLMAMKAKHDMGFIDNYFIFLGIMAETILLPISPLIYKLHKWEHERCHKVVNHVAE